MAKRPRPVRPTLERVDSDNVDSEGSVADESADEREGKSSKKFLFFFLFMMGLCCAGGYGYLEYKKKYSNDEVVVADDTTTQEEDQLAQSDPDKVDDKESSQDDPETEDEFIINTSSENEVISDSNTEQAETSDPFENASEEPEFKIDDLNSNENLLDEEEISTENPEEVPFDLDTATDEPLEKTELTSDNSFLENPTENKTEETSEQETVDPLEEEIAESEFDENEPDTLDLNETVEEDSADNFLPPKESRSVENTEPVSQIPEKKSEPERKRPRKLRPLRSGKSLQDESRNRIQSKIKRPSSQGRTDKNNSQAKIRWKNLGGKEYQSPAGLIYGPGSREGHRSKHILRHAKDQPDRKGKHGVFQVKNRDEVFLLLDEAYRIAKKRGPPSQVKLYRDGNRTIYTINMNRKIGYIGGQYGAQKNNPSAYKVRLVLEGKKVITAFPL